MMAKRPGVEWGGISLTVMAITAAAGLGLGALVAGAGVRAGIASDQGSISHTRDRDLSERLAAVDTALARGDVSRAIYEWRDAYGVALRSHRWDAMVAVGDAAVKIDASTGRPVGQPTGFRAEARQAYLRALFDARAAGAPDGIRRVSDAFAALGDTEAAARALKLLAQAR